MKLLQQKPLVKLQQQLNLNRNLPQAKETPSVRQIKHICDFSRCRLNVRVKALASNLCSEATNMLYLSYRGLCFGWGWNCYLLLEGFEDAPEGYSFRCNCFLKDWLELLLSLLTSSTNLSINLPRQPENRSPRIKSSIFVVWELRDYNKILEKADFS